MSLKVFGEPDFSNSLVLNSSLLLTLLVVVGNNGFSIFDIKDGLLKITHIKYNEVF